jgi:hypothetical protein
MVLDNPSLFMFVIAFSNHDEYHRLKPVSPQTISRIGDIDLHVF